MSSVICFLYVDSSHLPETFDFSCHIYCHLTICFYSHFIFVGLQFYSMLFGIPLYLWVIHKILKKRKLCRIMLPSFSIRLTYELPSTKSTISRRANSRWLCSIGAMKIVILITLSKGHVNINCLTISVNVAPWQWFYR